jgi:hypothetical protein
MYFFRTFKKSTAPYKVHNMGLRYIKYCKRPNRFCSLYFRDGGHKQLILNGERFRPAFAERDNKPTMIDLRGISTNWFKTQLYLSTRLSRLRAQRRYDMNRGGTT